MGIFDAIVKPLISIFSNTLLHEYSIPIFNSKFQFEYNIHSNEVTKNSMFAIDTTSTHKEKEIYGRIELNTIPLSSVIEFSRGIKTSDDSRFIKKVEISTDSKKIYRGKNIKAFSIQWNGEYIWYRPDLMKEKIGCVPYTKEFFETPEKIVIQRVNSSSQLLAAYDNQQRYFLDTVNVSKYNSWNRAISLKYLCGILNSNLINFWYCNKYKMPTIGIYEIHSIPIRISKNQQPFIELVDQILTTKISDPNADIRPLERAIDKLVYELYDITEEEIKIVEGK
ncbi:MAG: TaqI-like C-terminal specificity domain-containing protein [Ignavibacteria bacterium]|nr:TaqI-like C-terminal specificity domain-containing protein [Ignavibacteria bacterium]